MQIKGLKKAVGEYKRVNIGGKYSPQYGKLMYDTSTGEIWTDYFCSLGHNQWIQYDSASIVDLGKMMDAQNIDITMPNVKKYIADNIRED